MTPETEAKEDIFEEVWGKIIKTCHLCHHETREKDRKENHAFDCDRRTQNDDTKA